MSVWYREDDVALDKLKEMKREITNPKIEALGCVYKER